MVEVILEKDEDINTALERLKKKANKENIYGELRKREFYEKPSIIRNRKNKEIKKRIKRNAAKEKRKRER